MRCFHRCLLTMLASILNIVFVLMESCCYDRLHDDSFHLNNFPCGRGVKYAHLFLAFLKRQQKDVPMATPLQHGTTSASCVTSTGMPAQKAATILKPLMPDPHSTPFTHGATYMLLTGLHHSTVVSIPFLLPEIPPYSPFTSLSSSLSYVHESLRQSSSSLRIKLFARYNIM